MLDDLAVTLGEILDALPNEPYRNPSLILEIGSHYINNLGFLVKLVKRKVRPSSWKTMPYGTQFTHYYIDAVGQRYWPNGAALKSSVGGQPSRYYRSLADKAQKVKVGQRYAMRWDHDSTCLYTVTDVGPRGYDIVWDNGCTLHIKYGCPLNYKSVKI